MSKLKIIYATTQSILLRARSTGLNVSLVGLALLMSHCGPQRISVPNNTRSGMDGRPTKTILSSVNLIAPGGASSESKFEATRVSYTVSCPGTSKAGTRQAFDITGLTANFTNVFAPAAADYENCAIDLDKFRVEITETPPTAKGPAVTWSCEPDPALRMRTVETIPAEGGTPRQVSAVINTCKTSSGQQATARRDFVVRKPFPSGQLSTLQQSDSVEVVFDEVPENPTNQTSCLTGIAGLTSETGRIWSQINFDAALPLGVIQPDVAENNSRRDYSSLILSDSRAGNLTRTYIENSTIVRTYEGACAHRGLRISSPSVASASGVTIELGDSVKQEIAGRFRGENPPVTSEGISFGFMHTRELGTTANSGSRPPMLPVLGFGRLAASDSEQRVNGLYWQMKTYSNNNQRWALCLKLHGRDDVCASRSFANDGRLVSINFVKSFVGISMVRRSGAEDPSGDIRVNLFANGQLAVFDDPVATENGTTLRLTHDESRNILSGLSTFVIGASLDRTEHDNATYHAWFMLDRALTPQEFRTLAKSIDSRIGPTTGDADVPIHYKLNLDISGLPNIISMLSIKVSASMDGRSSSITKSMGNGLAQALGEGFPAGSSYSDLIVSNQPDGYSCGTSKASGTFSSTDITVAVTCSPPPTAPRVSGTSPTSNMRPTWEWTSGVRGAGAYRYRLNNSDLSGGTTTSDTSFTPNDALPDGRYTLYVQERDGFGKWSNSGSFEIIIETKAPIAPKVISTTPTNNRWQPWRWNSNGGGNGTYRYRLNNEDLSGGTVTKETSFAPISALPEGTNTLYVQERNFTGTWSSAGSFAINVDSVPPNAPKVTCPRLTNEKAPTWTWISGGNGGNGKFRYRRENITAFVTDYTTSTSHTPGIFIETVPTTLYVQELDNAGNWSDPGTCMIQFDLTPPKPPIVLFSDLSPTNDNTPTWTWQTDRGGDGEGRYRYRLDNSNSSGGTETESTRFTPDSLLPDGIHTLYVQERDSAGNWSSTASSSIMIDTFPPNPPSISGTTPTGDKTPTWTWTPGSGGYTSYRYRLDNDNWDGFYGYLRNETSYGTYTPGSDLTDGDHTLYVEQRDAAGNWSRGSSHVITIDTTPPKAPVSTGKNATNNSTPTWEWKSGGAGNGTYRYRLNNNDLTGGTTTTSTSYTTEGRLADGDHVLYVQERDDVGNWSSTSAFSINIDTIKPNFFEVTGPMENVASAQPIVTWGQAWDTTSVAYRLEIARSSNCATNVVQTYAGLRSTQQTLTKLDPGTWFVCLSATDVAGNVTIASNNDYTFTVMAPEPSQPMNIFAAVSNKTVSLVWPPPLSSGGGDIIDYIIEFKNAGSPDESWQTFSDGISPSTGVLLTELTNADKYMFRVAAVNSKGKGPYSPEVQTVPVKNALPFVSRWITDASYERYSGSSTKQISLPLVPSGTYNFIVLWGDGKSNLIRAADDPARTHTYARTGTYTVTIIGDITGWSFSYKTNNDAFKLIEISAWGPLNFGNTGGYFNNAYRLIITATDTPDLTGTSNMSAAFLFCSSIKSVPGMDKWNMSAVTNMDHMFYFAARFNQPIGTWNTSAVTNMGSMFEGATAFNQPIGTWNTSAVTDMRWMFKNATKFNQPIGTWNISSVTTMGNMLIGSELSIANYDALLIGWSKQDVKEKVQLDATLIQYSLAAKAARESLQLSKGWKISDGGLAP